MYGAYFAIGLSRVPFTTMIAVVLRGSFLAWAKPTTGALATTVNLPLNRSSGVGEAAHPDRSVSPLAHTPP